MSSVTDEHRRANNACSGRYNRPGFSTIMKLQLSRCFSGFLFVALALGSPASRSGPDADYWAERGQILAEESHSSLGGKLQFGYGERAANNVLMVAKEDEIDRGFRDPSDFLPARNFMTVAEAVRGSPTFQIIRDMPKGAVLHAHDTAIVSAQFVYENITFRENLHICRPQDGPMAFRFLRSPEDDTNCASSAGWEVLAELRANATIAGDLNTAIRNALTLVVPDPAAAYPNVDVAWVAFLEVFEKLDGLLSYRPVYEDYYYRGLEELREDNVLYIELRSTLPTLYDLDGNTYGPLDVARVYKTMTDRFVNDYPDFIGAKLIFAPLRTSLTASQMDEYLVTAAALKEEFPEFLAGFDLVGQEEKGEPLVKFADKLRAVSPDIRLFFHAGETKWNGLSTDDNLIDAVLLNATRIGHGYALLKHPKVLELAEERDIAIEVNPISNQVLTLVDDLRNHPASFLFARDFPVVVSSDDPGLWGAVGLSYDFYAAFVGIMSRSADIRALKQLAMNSIKYSAMSDEEKARAFRIWEEKWTMFIEDLVQSNHVIPLSKRSCEVEFTLT